MKISTKKTLIFLFEIFLLLCALIFLFPVILTYLNSFKTNSEIMINVSSLPKKIDFTNFIQAWKLTKFPKVFLNTLIITLFSVAGIILISSMAAYTMVRTNWKLSWVFFLIFSFSMVVPFHTIMIPLVQTAKFFNILNSIPGIIIIYLGVGCPFAIFMYHGFIKGIPKELEESASIDGAGPVRIFFQIVFPLLTPIHASIAILDVLWIWNDFLLPIIIIQSSKNYTIQLAQYTFFGQYRVEYGLALASLVLSSLPVIIFYLIMQKSIVKGITAGAIKG